MIAKTEQPPCFDQQATVVVVAVIVVVAVVVVVVVVVDRLYVLYSASLRYRADSMCSHVILHEELAFYSEFLNFYRGGVLTALTWLVPHEPVL